MEKNPMKRKFGVAVLIALGLFMLLNWALPSQPPAKEPVDVASLEEAFIDVANTVKP